MASLQAPIGRVSTMLVIYQDTREFLSLRTSRFVECMGLFFCGLGLLSLSVPLISLDKSIELSIPRIVIIDILYYGVTFGIAGIFIVFQQRKFLFYIPELRVICWEGPRQTRTVPFRDIEQIEIAYTETQRGMLNLVTAGGVRLLLTRGLRTELFPLANRISQVIGVPISSVEIAPPLKKK